MNQTNFSHSFYLSILALVNNNNESKIMGQYRCKIVILILFHSELQSKDSATQQLLKRLPKAKTEPTTDSLNLDLLALQKEGKLNSTTLITVHDDPVPQHYKHPTSIGHTAIKNLDAEKYQIVFECIDGYKPMMPLQNSFGQIISCRQGMHQRGIIKKS
jgi:hypothetical protein